MLTLSLFVLAGAMPLDFVWNISPSPHETYAACGGDTTVCVVPGEWWGVCRADEMGKTTKTLMSGTLALDHGRAMFSGCPFYQELIAKSVKLGGNPAKAAFADPGCQTSLGKSTVNLAPMGEKTFAAKSNPDGTLQFSELGKRVDACDDVGIITWSSATTVAWDGPPLPLVAGWDVDFVGDLNQDGAIELVLSKRSSRNAMTYVAMLGSLRGNAFEKLAVTVTTPKIALTPEAKTVQAVQDAHESCEHWGGEVGDNDAKRSAQIAAAQKKDCAVFKAKLGAARRKFPANATLIELSKSELAQ